MATEIQAARLMTYFAATRLDAGDNPNEAVAMAKLHTARVANRIADEAVQIFGGYGFIEETRVAMHDRDARILRIGGGTDEITAGDSGEAAGAVGRGSWNRRLGDIETVERRNDQIAFFSVPLYVSKSPVPSSHQGDGDGWTSRRPCRIDHWWYDRNWARYGCAVAGRRGIRGHRQ